MPLLKTEFLNQGSKLFSILDFLLVGTLTSVLSLSEGEEVKIYGFLKMGEEGLSGVVRVKRRESALIWWS